MIDGLYCTCGGYYDHVDSESDNGTATDSYQCGNCGTRSMATWRIGTGEVIKTEYDYSDVKEERMMTDRPFRLLQQMDDQPPQTDQAAYVMLSQKYDGLASAESPYSWWFRSIRPLVLHCF